LEGGSGTITPALLSVSDAEQGAAALRYQLIQLPEHGQLLRQGVVLVVNDAFSQSDINAGLLTYQHDSGETTNDTWSFTVSDGAGGIIGATPFAISVTPVNDAAQLTASATPQTWTENGSLPTLFADLFVADADNSTLQRATVTFGSGFYGAEDFLTFTHSALISSHWDNSTGILQLSGAAPLAEYQSLLRSLHYANAAGENPQAGVRTLQLQVEDGVDSSNLLSSTVTVVAVNDAPQLSAGALLAFTENDPATIVDGTITVSDPDNSTLSGAVVSISSGYVSGEDQLAFGNGGGITAIWQAATGSLTLSGSASLAAYQSALRSITYLNLGADTPTAGTRQLSWTINDGALNSAVANSQLVVSAVNDAPLLHAGGNLNFTENQAALTLDAALTLQDADDPLLPGATLTIRSGYDPGKDRLLFTDTAQIVGSWDGVNGRLTLAGSASQAAWQSALQSIRFANNSEDPQAGSRTIDWLISDGVLESAVQSTTITLQAVNDQPVLAGVSAATWGENGGDTTLAAAALVSDVDHLQLQGASVALTAGYVGSEDRLLFQDAHGIIGNWNGLTGVLTLQGAASLSDYQAALRSITYHNVNSENPTAGNRTLTWHIEDGSDSSLPVTVALTVQAVNDAPLLQISAGAASGVAYSEGDGLQTLDGALLLQDVDNSQLQQATVQIVSGYQSGEDLLAVALPLGLSSQWDGVSGTLTLGGAASLSTYQAALRSVGYQNSGGDDPTAGVRTVQWVVSDGVADSAAETVTLTLSAVNDAPILNGGAILSFTEGEGTSLIDATITVADADSSQLSGATVRFSSGYQSGEDRLYFTDGNGISGSWDGSAGVLTLTGTASAASYQTALRQVGYGNLLQDTPTSGSRIVVFQVSDGQLSSTLLNSQIVVSAVDDQPLVTADSSVALFSEGDGSQIVNSAFLLSDVDNSQLQQATLQFYGGYQVGEDQLHFSDTAAISGFWDSNSGALILSGTASLADYQAALRSVTYQNSAGEDPHSGLRTLRVTVHDGTLASQAATVSLQVAAINDAPSVACSGSYTFTEADSPLAVAPALLLSDPDNSTLERAVISLLGAASADQERLAAPSLGGIISFWDESQKTLTLTTASGTASLADYQTVLRALTYDNPNQDDPHAGNRTITIKVNDGVADSTLATVTVNMVAVNDGPVLNGVTSASAVEDQALLLQPITITDEDVAGGDLALSLTVTHGSIHLDGSALTVTAGHNNSAHLVVTGTLANLNEALATMIYQGEANYCGQDSLLVQVSDQGGSGNGGILVASHTVTLTVAAVNDEPVTGGDVILVTNEDMTLTIPVATAILANDSDVDGDTLSATIADWPGNGTLSDAGNGTWLYQPPHNLSGVVLFHYTLSDGHGGTALGTVNIVVHPVLDGLQAATDSVTAFPEDGFITTQGVLSNDRDPDYHASLPPLPDYGLNPDLAVIGFTQAAHGVAVYNGDGTFTYTPDPDYYGSDQLTYTLNAGDARIDVGTVTFTIGAVNDAPVWAHNSGFTVNEGGTVTFAPTRLQVTDVEQAATALLYTLENPTVHGTLSRSGVALSLGSQFSQEDIDQGRIGYQQDGSETSQDLFVVGVSDGAGGSLFATAVTLTITPVNDAPVLLNNLGATLAEGESVTLSSLELQVTDVDNSAGQLRYTVGSLPQSGQLYRQGVLLQSGDVFTQQDVDALLISYLHHGGETFSDSFSFGVSDGAGGQIASHSFAFTITPVNDVPSLVRNAILTVNEGASGLFDNTVLQVSDPEQSAAQLTYHLLALPDHGLLLKNGVTLTLSDTLTEQDLQNHRIVYRHDGSETSSDSWQFAVSDGAGGTIGATTATIQVLPVNDAPQLSSVSIPVTFQENGLPTPLFADLFVQDVDSLLLQGATVSFSQGYLAAEDQLSYTSQAGIVGSWDGLTGRLSLTGAATLSAYQAVLRSVGYQVSTGAADNPTSSNRWLQVTVNDGQLESGVVSQQLQLVAVNDAPVLGNGTDLAYNENDLATPIAPDLTITDPDSSQFGGATITIGSGYVAAQDRLAFVDQGGIHGSWNSTTGQLTLSGTASLAQYQNALRNVTYFNSEGSTPTEGGRTVEWRLQDGALQSAPMWRQVTVRAVNDPPLLTSPLALTVNEDQTLTISSFSLQDPDVANGLLELDMACQRGSLTLASTVGLNWLSGSNGSQWLSVTGTLSALQQALNGMHYQGESDFNGTDLLTWQVSDLGHQGSGAVGVVSRQVTLHVLPVEDGPVAGADAFTTPEDTPLLLSTSQWLANDVDVDGDTLSVQLLQGPQHGSLTPLANGQYLYRPNQDYNGVDSLRYRINDGHGNSGSALVTLIVQPIEDALQANPDRLSMNEDGAALSFSVLANDHDPDQAGVLQVIGFTATEHGRLYRLADQTFRYQPDHDFYGIDTFSYIINSGDARIGRATVEIEVRAVNDLPRLQIDNGLILRQGQQQTIGGAQLLVEDVEQGPSELLYTVASLPTHGTLLRNTLSLQVGMNFTQADLDQGLLQFRHDGSSYPQDGFRFTFTDQVTPQWRQVGWFPITIRLNAVPLPVPEKPSLPNKTPEVWLTDREGEFILRPSALQEAMPILTAIQQETRSVALQDSRTPLLTAVSNSNPGVQDGGLSTPVLNAVQRSIATVAPGALQTPVLNAVMSESSQAISPVLSGPAAQPGFAVRSGWYYFGPEFDLPSEDLLQKEGASWNRDPELQEPLAMPLPARQGDAPGRQEEQGLYACIERWEDEREGEIRALLAVWA
ncbi:MAG: tandem-95 repeat protein, partial [Magnetococcales bacterium]|nr:tandem-95 repeat protein [Magnetococcales bacterium]